MCCLVSCWKAVRWIASSFCWWLYWEMLLMVTLSALWGFNCHLEFLSASSCISACAGTLVQVHEYTRTLSCLINPSRLMWSVRQRDSHWLLKPTSCLKIRAEIPAYGSKYCKEWNETCSYFVLNCDCVQGTWGDNRGFAVVIQILHQRWWRQSPGELARGLK